MKQQIRVMRAIRRKHRVENELDCCPGLLAIPECGRGISERFQPIQQFLLGLLWIDWAGLFCEQIVQPPFEERIGLATRKIQVAEDVL